MRHFHGPTSHEGAAGEHGHPHPAEHGAAEGHVHRAVSRRRLIFSMILTGAMMVVELVGGILSGSLALVSDAGHMFTHFFALGVSYFAIRIAAMPASPEKSFGLYRAEILAALLNGVFLAAVTVYIAYESVLRLLAPVAIAGPEMLVVAALGLVVNLVSAGLLWGAGREDLNVRSAFVHMLGDTLSSVGVVAGAVVIMATGFVTIDPLLSVLIAAVIGVWSYRLLAQSVRILMEVTPPGVNLEDLGRALGGADPLVRRLHDLHVWEITSGMLAMTAIVTVVPEVTAADSTRLLGRLRRVAHEQFGIGHAIVQVEAEEAGGKGANDAGRVTHQKEE